LQKPLKKFKKQNEKAFYPINLNSHINRKIQFSKNQFLTPHLLGLRNKIITIKNPIFEKSISNFILI